MAETNLLRIAHDPCRKGATEPAGIVTGADKEKAA